MQIGADMQPDQLSRILRDLELTQAEFGRLLDTPLRTAQYWCANAVPAPAAVVAELLVRRPELVEVLRAMADERDAKSSRDLRRGK